MAANPHAMRSRDPQSFPVTLPPGTSPEDRKQLVIEVIRATGMPPRQAAMSIGISSSAYYRLAEDPEFVEEMEQATSVYARRLHAVIARAAARLGSVRAAQFWLERRMGEYAPMAKLDQSLGARSGFEDLTDEELNARLSALRGRSRDR